jgi:multicomponent Na+:H+ antiporter subunit B
MKLPDVFFRTLATPIVFALIALGFHFFLRGHNAPGGGFIAGLIVAVAALLGRMARDLQLLRIRSEELLPIGLLLALGTGAMPMLWGKPFLRSEHGYLTWPLIGRFEWSTAVVFDAGVFLVVVGTTITIIDLLAESGNLRRLDGSFERPPARDEARPSDERGEG